MSSPTACTLNSLRLLSATLTLTLTLSITVTSSDSALLADRLGEATFYARLDLGKQTAARFRFTGTGCGAVATDSGPDARVRRPLDPARQVGRSVGDTEDAQCDHLKSSQDAVQTPRTKTGRLRQGAGDRTGGSTASVACEAPLRCGFDGGR